MYLFFQLYFDEITFDALGSSQALFSFPDDDGDGSGGGDHT